jgi:hypothetical protein
MTLLVVDVGEVDFLNQILNRTLLLKLFSNNKTPAATDTVASYNEVSSGGYADIDLTFANWTVTDGPPAVALYNDFQDFNFIGATSGPGTIYGYYVTTDDELTLLWAERFPPADVPFTPINGSLIRFKPRLTLKTEGQ